MYKIFTFLTESGFGFGLYRFRIGEDIKIFSEILSMAAIAIGSVYFIRNPYLKPILFPIHITSAKDIKQKYRHTIF